jgi:hypothetical protein
MVPVNFILFSRSVFEFSETLFTNDVTILAQIQNKRIEGIISKDVSSVKQYIFPLTNSGSLQVKFIDLNIPLNQALGQLFP